VRGIPQLNFSDLCCRREAQQTIGSRMRRAVPLLLAGVLCLDFAHKSSVDAFLPAPTLLRGSLSRHQSSLSQAVWPQVCCPVLQSILYLFDTADWSLSTFPWRAINTRYVCGRLDALQFQASGPAARCSRPKRSFPGLKRYLVRVAECL
jgi:hypothetical protein